MRVTNYTWDSSSEEAQIQHIGNPAIETPFFWVVVYVIRKMKRSTVKRGKRMHRG